MPLNLSASGGDFMPYLKFNAKAGRFYARFEEIDEEVEVPPPRLLFDFDNIQTGWIAFGVTGAPQVLWDPSLTQEAPKPSWEGAKRGFRVAVIGNDKIQVAGNRVLGVRELMATATAIITPILKMYEFYETDQPSDALPFYKCTRVNAVKGHKGAVNYEPVFEFMQWIDRARVPGLEAVADHGEQAQEPAPAAGSFAVNEPAAFVDPAYVEDEIPF